MKLARLLLLSLLLGCHPDVRSTSTLTREPAWQDFTPETFARAARENKLILISLQAGFCHWCHVMNATTYRDARVLALLAEHFVLLRADEASRPDLRERYAAWGWPATALLTPDARPIVNLRGHQPAAPFATLLAQLVDKHRRGLPLELTTAAPHGEPQPLEQTLTLATRQLDSSYDAREGGWGSPQKYPFAAPVEDALLRGFLGDTAAAERARRSLQGYRQLLDPVAGGLFQYSLEGVWTAPHYEKLLAIQASALESFAAGYRATADTALLTAAQSVARYVLTTLRAADGAFYASQEADVGHVGQPDYQSGAVYYAGDAATRARSRAPGVDTHVYANLNGQLIEALCQLYRADGDASWLRAAREATTAVRKRLARGPVFVHAEGEQTQVFYLSDQVEMARALYALSSATGELALGAEANRILDWLAVNLHDERAGGFFSHTQNTTQVGVFAERLKPVDENAKLARLWLDRSHVEDNESFQQLAERTLVALSSPEVVRPLGRQVGEYLLALRQLTGPYVMFSVVGEAHDPHALALQQAAYRAYVPHGLVSFRTPAESRYPYPGRAAVYLCSDNACSAPVLEVDRLAEQLASFLADSR